MDGPPARPACWWAPAPDPDLASISRRRAFTEVLLVFAAFFLAGILGAAYLLAGRYRNALDAGSWAAYSIRAVEVVAQIGLALAVVLLLCARRRVSASTLGLRLPRTDDGRLAVSRSIRIAAWGLFALTAGGIVNALLQTGHLPTGTPNAPELIFGMVDSVQAGVVEELVVLAFVVVTLRQARCPWWQVTVVAVLLRASYHIYYGPGVLGILLWAALYYWTYLRFRELVPLMICHAGWDAVGFLSQRWAAVTGVAILVVIAIWLTAGILWLAERNNHPAAGPAWPGAGPSWPGAGPSWPGAGPSWPGAGPGPGVAAGPGRGVAAGPGRGVAAGPGRGVAAGPGPGVAAGSGRGVAAGPGQGAGPAPAGPPPGWHPDPAGYNRWRWWDGHRWTEHVSSHG